MSKYRFLVRIGALFLATMSSAAFAQTRGLQSGDLLKLRSVGEVKYSPDGAHITYAVINNDGDRRPYSQLWVMTVADGKSIKLSGEKDTSSNAEWSPDGRWIAYEGDQGN
jgi:Tol biopolymer transport system component